MDTYIITGKTVEEAISAAKKQYEDENHEISYEILEMPKKGLFGLGAKDAKLRVTVTKAEKVELGSLVAEMRSMRNLTDRNGDSDKPKKKPEQKQNQNQNGQPKEQKEQKEQKPKQAQPNQPKEQAQPGQKQTQQTPPKPQNADVPPKEQTQPKPPKPPKESKPNQPKPQPQKEPVLPEEAAKEPALPREAPAPETVPETPAVPAAETPVPETPETTEAAPSAASAASAGAKFGDASAEYKSSLHNSAKPNRRPPQKPSSGAQTEKIDSAAVTVSQPMGLADFVSDGAPKEFGKSSGSGRMNNDVKRKKKPAPAASAGQNSSAGRNSSAGQNSSAGRNPKPAAQKPVNPAPNGRYDFAESDDDYKKLDELVRESENELEAAEAAVLVPRPASADEPSAEASADEELSPVLPEHEERRREAITQEEMDFALAFANQLMENMKLNARAVPASCPEGEEFEVTEEANVYPKIDIVGDDTGILIGHHGETLDSIQYLVNLSALRKTKSKDGDYVKIVVDIENYRAKREETLRTLARRMAARAVKYKRNVFLEPMNAYERRIIHSELQTFENVSTHSVGTDRDRKIIITYEGPDKQPDNRSMNGTRPANGTRPTGRKRRETAPAGGNDAGGTNPAVGTNPAGENRSGARRRPRKTQKMPIEKIGELLPGGDEKSE